MKLKLLALSLLLLLSSCHEEREFPIGYEKEHPEVLFDVNVEDMKKLYDEKEEYPFRAGFYINHTLDWNEDEDAFLMEYLIPLADTKPIEEEDDHSCDYSYDFFIYYSRHLDRTPYACYSFYFHSEKNYVCIEYNFTIAERNALFTEKLFPLSDEDDNYILNWMQEHAQKEE